MSAGRLLRPAAMVVSIWSDRDSDGELRRRAGVSVGIHAAVNGRVLTSIVEVGGAKNSGRCIWVAAMPC